MGMITQKSGILPANEFVLGFDAGQSPAWKELAYDSSGGDPTIFFSESSGQQRELFFLRDMTTSICTWQENQSHDLETILEEIQSVFGLNQTELAEACKLTRKSLYDWQKGSRPRRKSADRVRQLHRAAMDWRRSDFPVPDGFCLHKPVLRDASLFDLLQADPLDLEAIHFAGARMSMRKVNEQADGLANPFSQAV